VIGIRTRGSCDRSKCARRRRRPERRHTRTDRHRIGHFIDPRRNDAAVRSRRKQIGSLVNLVNRSSNGGHIGRPAHIQRIRRRRTRSNRARRKRRDLKERRLERARRCGADIEGADGDGGSDERRVVHRAQRENVGPREGIVGA
jgi:hypothetical protein